MERTREELLIRALRLPRGRYQVSRAAQLSGIPERTLYDWAANEVLIPDYAYESPKMWSYRDLILLRMVFWLRSKGMDRDQVSLHVSQTRDLLSTGDNRAARARSSGGHLHRANDLVSDDGQVALPELVNYLDEFAITAAADAINGTGHQELWGPDLVAPSARSRISPWVMSGEPCIRDTRIPTSTVYGLHESRALSPTSVVRLYPGISEEDVVDALNLESRLRGKRLELVA